MHDTCALSTMRKAAAAAGAHQAQVPKRCIQVVQDGALSLHAGDGVAAQPHGRAVLQQPLVDQAGSLLLQHERPCACGRQGTALNTPVQMFPQMLVQLSTWQASRHRAGCPKQRELHASCGRRCAVQHSLESGSSRGTGRSRSRAAQVHQDPPCCK